ncbi:DJ-1/PfpI family protein [Paenibacillus sp. BK720]|uniref:DJ-1/PfpI family protein n=1 Tax=Paenibacillus sp. BK720 TaxID=2587092 RepID=UPI001420D7C4|nr:DJ-1/PfpI family protein [Paenibacillus sp. BK720]NIK71967.1 transcriptional regulator GlxA family with amidase domain [Paenibacillus sp. BK720]
MKKMLGLLLSLTLVLTLVAPGANAKTKKDQDADKDQNVHVQIVLFNGFDLLDALGPYEVFTAAGMYSNGAITVELVSAEGKRSVPSGLNGPSLTAEAKLDPNRSGIILVPGAAGKPAGNSEDAIPKILGKAANSRLTELMHQAFRNKEVTVATVCGGSLLLAMKGLLKDRYAVTNELGMNALKALGANPVDARIVEDNPRLVSGGGVTSGLDIALYLVERELGPQIAKEIENLFEYERRGTVWKAEGMKPVDFNPGLIK